MKTVNIHEAKTHLSQLIKEAVAGEKITIARYGEPVVTLEPIPPPKKIKRTPGKWKGKGWISDDFDAPDPDLEREFYDNPI